MSADTALAHMERAVSEYGRVNQRLHKALHASRAHTAEVTLPSSMRACAHVELYAHSRTVCAARRRAGRRKGELHCAQDAVSTRDYDTYIG